MENGESSYRRFIEGDKNAFDDILNIYKNNLIFFINQYVHNLTIAEDIAIDTFIELIIHKHRYNFKVSLKTYIFMIGRCKSLDYLKHQKIIDIVSVDDIEKELVDYNLLEDEILANEQKRTLNNAINELPNDMRIAIHLVYFENMTYEETAKIMKKSCKQVDNLLYRAKNALRSIIGTQGGMLI